MTSAVDHYGTSIYPKHAAAATPWSPVRLMSALDGIRSAARDRGWWIGELQAGQGATGVRVATPVTAADLRLWGWAALSRGARAISYYAWYPMSSGYESNGYGMIELDGTITDRARAAGEFAGNSPGTHHCSRRCVRGRHAWRCSTTGSPTWSAAIPSRQARPCATRCWGSTARCSSRTSRRTSCTLTRSLPARRRSTTSSI